MTIKEIEQALEEGQSLKSIAQAYSEIANLKTKKLRGEVERNRVFFEEIAKIYAIVRRFAIKKNVNIVKPKKAISIVLTSNHGFYGKINADLLRFFIETTQKFPTDRICLGRTGIEYLKAKAVFEDFKEIILKEDQPDAQELMSLVNILKDYNQVLVFFSSLKSLLIQVPKVTDVTASTSSIGNENKSDNEVNKDYQFIFEPELLKVMQFFDSQITTLLLEQTFLESELARTAARFISMDTAESEANKFIGDYTTRKAFAKRTINNNKILENFATMAAVRKEAAS